MRQHPNEDVFLRTLRCKLCSLEFRLFKIFFGRLDIQHCPVFFLQHLASKASISQCNNLTRNLEIPVVCCGKPRKKKTAESQGRNQWLLGSWVDHPCWVGDLEREGLIATNIAPENRAMPKGNFIFQPSIFRAVLVSGRVYDLCQKPRESFKLFWGLQT